MKDLQDKQKKDSVMVDMKQGGGGTQSVGNTIDSTSAGGPLGMKVGGGGTQTTEDTHEAAHRNKEKKRGVGGSR
jgi:tripartite-type tricarboxylate transporter receptor subunit TctC